MPRSAIIARPIACVEQSRQTLEVIRDYNLNMKVQLGVYIQSGAEASNQAALTRGVTLANRIVMAPMTRGFALEGLPGKPQADYYRARALGEVGGGGEQGQLMQAERPLPAQFRRLGLDAGQGGFGAINRAAAQGTT